MRTYYLRMGVVVLSVNDIDDNLVYFHVHNLYLQRIPLSVETCWQCQPQPIMIHMMVFHLYTFMMTQRIGKSSGKSLWSWSAHMHYSNSDMMATTIPSTYRRQTRKHCSRPRVHLNLLQNIRWKTSEYFHSKAQMKWPNDTCGMGCVGQGTHSVLCWSNSRWLLFWHRIKSLVSPTIATCPVFYPSLLLAFLPLKKP